MRLRCGLWGWRRPDHSDPLTPASAKLATLYATRKIKIDGDLKLKWAWPIPHLVTGRLSFGNPPWAREPYMIELEAARTLLWRAASIQAPVSSNRGHGVGIYRLGCASARPLFYLWGTIDQAGFLAPSAPSTQQDHA